MATILLIRHGEPTQQGVFLGQQDPPLSASGKEHLSRALSHIEVAAIWCSPLQRALQTAEYLRSSQHTVLPDLKEIHYGEWTGRTWAGIEAQWPELAARKAADWLSATPPGGEEWHDFINRVRRAWTIIQAGPTPAAVVAHQGVNAALVHLINGKNPFVFSQQYGEVIRVEYD